MALRSHSSLSHSIYGTANDTVQSQFTQPQYLWERYWHCAVTVHTATVFMGALMALCSHS